MNDVEKNTQDLMSDKELGKIIQSFIKKGDQASVFEKNILAICTYSGLLAKKILACQKNGLKKFQLIKESNEPLDLNILRLSDNKKLHERPYQEIRQDIIDFEMEYSKYRILYFFGLGTGIFHKTIAQNPNHEVLVIFEVEIEIIYIVLNYISFHEELLKGKIYIMSYDLLESNKNYYRSLANKNILVEYRNYVFHMYNSFYDNQIEIAQKINVNLLQTNKYNLQGIGNHIIDILVGLSNTLKNYKAMYKNIPYKKLLESRKYKNKTAVIVSTGPSLHKQLETLKKAAPFVTIIAVDASYPILKKHNIKPDYVTSIERVKLTSNFFNSKTSSFDDDIVFVTAALTSVETLKKLSSKKNLCLVLRPLIFELSLQDYMFGYAGYGISAAHLALDLSMALGHKNVILIGQDLAYAKDGTSHSKGHIFGQNEVSADKGYEVTAYGGEGTVLTNYVWDAFREYFEYAVYQEKNVKVYNATEGGARINGTIEKPFKELVSNLKFPKNQPKIKTISEKTRNSYLKKFEQHISNTIKCGVSFRKKLDKLFLKITKEVEKNNKLIEKNNFDKINFDKVIKLLDELEKIKVQFTDGKFRKYLYCFCESFLVHTESEVREIVVRNCVDKKQEQEKMLELLSVQAYTLFAISKIIQTVIDILTSKIHFKYSDKNEIFFEDLYNKSISQKIHYNGG